MKKFLLILIVTLISFPVFAQPDGFISFYVTGQGTGTGVVPVTQRGIVTGINRSAEGVFPITFYTQQDENFQISVSNQEHPIAWFLTNVTSAGVTLNVRKITGETNDPDTLCTVTIELAPPCTTACPD